jgi:DNA-binding CsgD family transcriptional regulator
MLSVDSSLLRRRDLAALLDVVDELGAMETLDDLRRGVPPRLAQLIPCDASVYQEMSLTRGETSWITEPLDASDGADRQDFVRNAGQHPVVRHFQGTGDPRAYRISDFIGVREYHATDLYDLFFGPLGVERLMTSLLPVEPGAFVAAVVCREPGSDFGVRDRALLNALVPHLRRSYDRAVARERVERLLRGLGHAGDDSFGVVLLAASGAPELMTDQARAWLGGDRLPEALADWVAACRGSARATTATDAPGGRLVVRFVRADRGGGHDALLIERASRALSPAALRAHGLSRREVELLVRLAHGGTNAQIAADLLISPATVRNHLNTIFAKLGVHDRGSAVARARELSATRLAASSTTSES